MYVFFEVLLLFENADIWVQQNQNLFTIDKYLEIARIAYYVYIHISTNFKSESG
jgi:hypothetical protein